MSTRPTAAPKKHRAARNAESFAVVTLGATLIVVAMVMALHG